MKPSALKQLPWATFGRRESTAEFFKKIAEEKERFPLLPSTPLLSLLIQCDDHASKAEFTQCLESLRAQSYPRWEAIFFGGTQPARFKKAIETFQDKRFRWVEEDTKSAAGARTSGEWLGFLSAADVLSPTALFQFVQRIQKEEVDLLYANDILLSKKGDKPRHFYSKCAFSWFTLLHFNYIGSFWLVRREYLDKLENSADYADAHTFLLRLAEKTPRFCHLPLYLRYLRKPEKIEASQSVKTFLKGHLERLGIQAKVRLVHKRILVTPEIAATEPPLVSAIICFKDRPEWTIECVTSLVRQVDYAKLEIVLVNNRSTDESLAKVREAVKECGVPVEIVNYPGAFNFGHMHNSVIKRYCRGEYLLLLNNDVFLKGNAQLDSMIAWAQFAWVGTVGMLLRYEHGGVQHSGLSAYFGGTARMARVGNGQERSRYAQYNREVFGNTFAACLMKRATFDAIGGFREIDLANGFGDVAFNFECLRKNLRNLYLGHIEGVHLESASRGQSYEYWEECTVEREYCDILQKMLREELGIDLIPQDDEPAWRVLTQLALARLRVSAPWLKPIKDEIKKQINRRTLPASPTAASESNS